MRSPYLFKLLALGVLATSAWADSAARKTVWTGVYPAEQAKRGEAAYVAQCSRCHRDDLSGYTGLKGSKFVDNWREDSLSSLWTRISKTMPAGAPGTLKESEYLDILAYMLRENEFPAGAQELNAGAIPNIRFEGKDGAGPVPDFSLVQVVGCLSKDPDGAWRLKRATDPLRTRDPNASPAPVMPPGK